MVQNGVWKDLSKIAYDEYQWAKRAVSGSQGQSVLSYRNRYRDVP
jgi:hypothetical protein